MEAIKDVAGLSWHSPQGFDAGIEQSILVDTLDQQAKTGLRTRFVRFHPDAATSVPFIHDYNEEVYLVEGDQALLDKDSLALLERYAKGSYFIRPAGTWHGPFSSQEGCLLFEIHSYP